MTRALLLLLQALGPLQAPAGAAASELVAAGDARYQERAAGARGAVADTREIDAALVFYRRARAAAPEGGEALFKLLRALHFKGAFTGATEAEQKAAFDEGRRLGQDFVERVERELAGRGAAARLAKLRAVPHAASVYFWTAACWGQWALVRGKLAAAREGVAGKIRDLAETVIALDPELEEGGGYRVLGRLHHQSPRIPLLTGWVSKDRALQYLRRSYDLAPQNLVTRYFLGEAILDHERQNAEVGRRLLKSCLDAPPRPEYLVEDRHYAEAARARLAGLR